MSLFGYYRFLVILVRNKLMSFNSELSLLIKLKKLNWVVSPNMGDAVKFILNRQRSFEESQLVGLKLAGAIVETPCETR